MDKITPFQKCIEKNDIEKFKFLLKEQNINLSYNHSSIIRYAYKEKRIEIVKLLLKDGRIDPSGLNNELLREVACNPQDISIFKTLLKDERVSPQDFFNQSYVNACKNNNKEAVELLLNDYRVNPFGNDADGFFHALEKGYHSIIDIIWNNEKFIKSKKSELLGTISMKGTPEMLDLIFKTEEVEEHSMSYLIFFAHNSNKMDNVKYLWKNKKCRELLKKNEIDLFNKLSKLFLSDKLELF